MINVDSCHDYSYENTAKGPEILFVEGLFFMKNFKSISVCGMFSGHHIRNETGKQMLGRK